MAFELPALPYAYDALNETIDTETMHLHHDKHHQAYVNNLNAAVEGTPFADMSIDELVRNVNQAPAEKKAAIRNNGGGHYNHSMFWEIMTPGGPAAPGGDLGAAVEAFGGLDALKDAVNKACKHMFDAGVVSFYCGHGPYHVRMLPPLGVMKETDWPRVMACVEKGLAACAAELKV